MNIDICIPAHNEADIIVRSAETLLALRDRHPSHTWRFIVSDNGSSDGTAERLRAVSSSVDILMSPLPGKGGAIRRAAEVSKGDAFGYIDADLSPDPEHLAEFAGRIASGAADIVIGSRLVNEMVVERSFFRTLTSKIYNRIAWFLLGVRVADAQCGLKLMNTRARELVRKTREIGWFLDIEFLALAQQRGLRIEERPVRWKEFRYVARKPKLRVVRDGILSIKAMVAIRMRLARGMYE